MAGEPKARGAVMKIVQSVINSNQMSEIDRREGRRRRREGLSPSRGKKVDHIFNYSSLKTHFRTKAL